VAETRYTGGEYLQTHPTWHAEDSAWKASHIVRILRANHIRPTSICDVGCGAGEVLKELWHEFGPSCSLYGYDISPQAVALARQNLGDKAIIELGDITKEKCNDFEVMLLIDVIEHIEDCYGFLRKIKPKSRYKVLHIPLDLSVQSILRSSPILENRRLAGHIHYFTKELALATLIDIGYEVIDVRYTAGAVDLPPKTLKIHMARLPRKLLAAINQDMAARLLGGFSLMVLAE
jgi:SAM-dependent methyltransferase